MNDEERETYERQLEEMRAIALRWRQMYEEEHERRIRSELAARSCDATKSTEPRQ